MKQTKLSSLFRRGAALVLALLLTLPTVYADAGEQRLQTSTEVTDGLTYKNTITENYSKRVESFSMDLELAPDSPVHPIFLQGSGSIYGAASINRAVSYAQAMGYHVLGAINTDFFATNTGVPMGIVVENGVYKSSNSANENAVLITNGALSLAPATPNVSMTLKIDRDGTVITPHHFNKYRASTGGIYLLNEYFSTHSTQTKTMGWSVRMKEVHDDSDIPVWVPGFDHFRSDDELSVNSNIKLEVQEVVHGDQPLAIGKDEYILTSDDDSGYGFQLKKFKVGDKVTLSTSCSDPALSAAQWASGVGDIMVKDGKLTNTNKWTYVKSGRAPRTALGVKPDGTAVLYAVDGRQNNHSVGLTQVDLATEMMKRGCTWAVNLDGGGSTALSIWLPGKTAPKVVSSPSDGTPRGCATYMLMVSEEKGDGKPDRLAMQDSGAVVLTNSSMSLPAVSVLDNGLNILPTHADDLEITSQLGTITNGVYIAGSKPGTDTLKFHSKSLNIDGEAQIHVVNTLSDFSVTRKGSSDPVNGLSAKPGDSIKLSAYGTYWGRTALRGSTGVTWSVPSDVGTVDENGIFTASLAGKSGTITAKAGGRSRTIPFTSISIHKDVPPEHWAHNAVEYCYQNHIVTGISPTEFGPDLTVSRGDFMVMLYGALGKPSYAQGAKFDDVAPSDYYYNAISWGVSNHLTTGMSKNNFGPKAPVRRQDAITILRNALTLMGKPIPDASLSILDSFADKDQIDAYAMKPIASMVAQNLISGTPEGISPKGPMTRAAMAVVLHKASTFTPKTDVPTDPVEPEKPVEPDLPDAVLSLDQSEVTIKSGQSITLVPKLTPEVPDAQIAWQSSSPSSAAVSPDGVVTNLFAGVGSPTVTVTAYWGDQTASCTVVCEKPDTVGIVHDAEDGLNVRSGPGVEHPVLDYLPNGLKVLVIGQGGGWYRVMFPNKEDQATVGYVSGEFLTVG